MEFQTTLQLRHGAPIFTLKIKMKNQPTWLVEHEILLGTQSVTYSYDKESDVLEIFFQRGGGLGIDIADNIVLRFNKETGQALSLILTSFSKLIQPTKYGPSSFPLTALSELPTQMQEDILRILQTSPVNYVLKLSGLTLPNGKSQPITWFEKPDKIRVDSLAA